MPHKKCVETRPSFPILTILRSTSMRLLLVEDDDQIAQFVQQGLEEAGYVVDWTANGEDSFRMGLNESYDVAVIDLMLPGRGGLV